MEKKGKRAKGIVHSLFHVSKARHSRSSLAKAENFWPECGCEFSRKNHFLGEIAGVAGCCAQARQTIGCYEWLL